MAKRIVDEEMRFSVVINGNEAQKELFELEKATRDLTQTNKNLKAEKDKLRAQGKQDTAEYKNLTASIKQNNVTIEANKAKMKELQGQLGLTSLTMRQLRTRANELALQLHNMSPGSAQYLKLQADLKAVNTRMAELRLNSQAAKSSIATLADGFTRYAALGASVIATGTGLVLSIQKMIDFNGQLSDSQADVMKTTGLTKAEVDDLSKSFGMMKTRTARMELLKLAEEAGRLGVTGVKNLQDYVKAANQMKVALGDDLSDEQIRDVGKMTNIYEVGTQTGKEFAEANLALGSAINEVSASGANQAGFLVDYLRRQAGIAKQAKISADQNIGYAATFDEIGQSVEISATAMNKVWMDLFSDTKTYAKIAGMSVKDFSNLLETDANEAMIRFLEGLNGNNEGLTVMVEKLEDIDVGGARGAQALSALAGSTDLLRKRQDLANEALMEATSLTNEYNVKNNNLAATLDKIRKKLMGWFASETIVNTMERWVQWFAAFIGAADDSSESVEMWRERLLAAFKVLLIITAAVLSYKAAIQLATLWTARSSAVTKIHYALLIAQEVATKSLAVAKALLTGNIRQAVVAWRALTAAMALNPFGAAFAIIAAIVAAYYAFSENAKKAATAQSLLNDATKQAVIDTRSEINEVNALLAVARDETASKGARLVAIKKLNEISPEYLGNLSLENVSTEEATKSLDAYVESLMRAAKAKALKAQLDAKAEELANAEGSSLEDNIAWYEKLWNQVSSLNNVHAAGIKNAKTALDNKKEYVDATKEEVKVLADLYQQQLKTNSAAEGKKNQGAVEPKEGEKQLIEGELYEYKNGRWQKVVFKPKGDPGQSAKDSYKVDPKREESELRRIQEENDRLKASLISESFKREIALEESNHQAKLQKLREQMIEEAELLTLDKEIVKATASGDTKKADALAKTKEIWVKRNAELNRQIEFEEDIHQNRIGAIIQKGLEDDFKTYQTAFEREKKAREIAHNLEMAALGNDKKARARLQENFNREEAEREARHLEELLAKMKTVLDGGEFKGFNLELLTEEQKQALLDFLDEANLKLSDLINKASGTGETAARIDGDVDVLGFSIDDWTKTFENLDTTAGKIEAAQMAVGAMMNAWSMYSNFVAQKERASLQEFERNQEAKASKLQRQLDSGYINQRQYNKAVEELEKETQRKRAEMEYKRAKREKEMAVANIILNTAAGVAKAIAQGGFVLGVPWAAIVGALGAVQLGMALATPLPAKGYEEGLYPVRREQDGKVFNARNGGNLTSGLVKKPTILVAEKDPEMIIDGGAWKQMHPGVKDSIYRELGRMGRVPGYEGGYYRGGDDGGSSSSDNSSALMQVIHRNTEVMAKTAEVLDRIERNGINAKLLRSLENAKKIQDDINDYNDLRNSNKK